MDQPPSLKGLHILLVDDEIDARELIATLLMQYDAQVTAVASSAEALKTLARLKPDLLISDIGMPYEDGYALIRKVRALDAEQGRIPAIALTAYAREEDRTQALSAGFQMHIAKPVNLVQLTTGVVQLTGRNEL